MTINQAAKVIKTLDTPKQKQDVQTEKHITSMASMYDVLNHSVLTDGKIVNLRWWKIILKVYITVFWKQWSMKGL